MAIASLDILRVRHNRSQAGKMGAKARWKEAEVPPEVRREWTWQPHGTRARYLSLSSSTRTESRRTDSSTHGQLPDSVSRLCAETFGSTARETALWTPAVRQMLRAAPADKAEEFVLEAVGRARRAGARSVAYAYRILARFVEEGGIDVGRREAEAEDLKAEFERQEEGA